MKKFLTIVMTVIILVAAITSSTVTFAASVPTTTITSVKAQSKAFTVKWKKKTGITGYQIQYSTSSKFSKKSTKTVKIKKAKTTSKKITDLKSSKKYYVRVRTYKNSKKKTDYSAWSKKKSITTKQANHCTNNNNHSIKCGNMGKWFNSRDEVDDYWVQIDNDYYKQWQDGKITVEEYYKISPYGYESWSCSYCGKWTGNFKYN